MVLNFSALKGQDCVISSDLSFKEGLLRFTTVPLKPLCLFSSDICVCKLIETCLYSAPIYTVRCVEFVVYVAHTRNCSWIQVGFDMFTHTYLYIKRILKGFKGTVVNRTFLAWRVIWTYAYSPCKYYGSFSFFVFVYLFVHISFPYLSDSISLWFLKR